MIYTSSILLASILLGGCETANTAYYTTTEQVVLAAECRQKIAADAVAQLKRTFLPASTTFWLPPDVAKKPFGHALDQELRNAGYAIVSKPPGIEVAYVVDRFGENEDRVQVVAGDDYEMSRLYAEDDDGELEAEGGFTERSEPMPAPKPVKVKAWAQSLQAEPKTAEVPALAKVAAKETGPGKMELPALAKPVAAVVTPTPEIEALRVPPTLDPSKYSIIEPDADNVVQLNPNLFIVPVQTTNNPFLQLYQPPYKPKDEKIIVSAAIPGPNPTCIINGMMFAEGDKFEGALAVYRVDADEIYLQRGAFLLKCPVSDRELTLRLP
jgi:hypothetical protein